LLNFLSSASDGVILFGADPAGRVCLSELLGLCMDLENCGLGRWEVLPLLEGSNTAGAAQTLLAECGFPASVRFTSQEAEYSAQEWSAENLLERGEIDLVIWAGAESWLSPAAMEKMNKIPSIVLSCQPPAWTPAAWLRVARFGIESRGTALRLDGIPISLEAPFHNAAAEMASVLARLEEAA
jgi:formylmethanofuran dehydrogenase subunit B